ncbi:MAG: YggS family pyridoxal phosphate-dependent enzyme [Ignavibacteriae bacterium]|nr:YggS family pyridoxal phosphate-dependent enzyme [Ignavibacteriota bacterium]
MNNIQENIAFINQKILEKCYEIGRNPSEITLVAVSKLHSVEEIEIVNSKGILNFAENKAQELDEKNKLIDNKIKWHFIGHLQTNKVKIVVPIAEFIHSVDSIKLAEEINKRAQFANKIQRILLEVKTSDEDTKYGISNFEDLEKIADYCKKLQNIKLVGLMTMAPYTENEILIRKSFKKLAIFKSKLIDKGVEIQHLSMGMTNDFEIAIEEGATILRIGTAIFGERNYSLNKV